MSRSEIEGFRPLSSAVSLDQPKTLDILREHKSHAPSLIVICSWMGALPKYIAKYTAGYQAQYPAAAILLIRCAALEFFQSDASARRKLAPACEIIRSHASLPAGTAASGWSTLSGDAPAASAALRPRILLHAFSNGGATMAVHLATALRLTPGFQSKPAASLGAATGKGSSSSGSTSTASVKSDHSHRGGPPAPPPLPFTALILDCCPGAPSIPQATLAFSLSLPRLLRPFGRSLIGLLLTLYSWAMRLLRREDALTALRRNLNAPAVLGPTPASTPSSAGSGAPPYAGLPRMYLYSRQDRLVGWRDVAAHARAAREAVAAGGQGQWQGIEAAAEAVVREEVFEAAPHCALMVTERERYWRVVREFVESGRREGGGGATDTEFDTDGDFTAGEDTDEEGGRREQTVQATA